MGVRFVYLTILSVLGLSCTGPTVKQERLERLTYITEVDQSEKEFFLYVPRGYDENSNEEWPVLLFLHGDGERGNGKEELGFVLIHGPLYEAWIQKRDLPFFIISPQLPMFGRDTLGISYLSDRDLSSIPTRTEGTPERMKDFPTSQPMAGAQLVDSLPLVTLPQGWDLVEHDLLNMIDQVKQGFKVDAKRVYISGLSYGGFGTWYMISQYPEVFAAANPVVGWGHPDLMEPIARANLPLWVVSGGRDPVVEKKFFLPGLNKLEELGHTNLLYTIHDDMGHDAWTRVYSGEDIYSWFLSQSKNK